MDDAKKIKFHRLSRFLEAGRRLQESMAKLGELYVANSHLILRRDVVFKNRWQNWVNLYVANSHPIFGGGTSSSRIIGKMGEPLRCEFPPDFWRRYIVVKNHWQNLGKFHATYFHRAVTHFWQN